MAQIAAYDAVAADRTKVRDFTVTFAYGKCLTVPMQWSISDLEAALRTGEITNEAYCADCGEHVTECPDAAHLLVEWPERVYSTTWGGTGTAHELGLVVFSGQA